nr:vegetative cell wall protein gp1-like [Penaeus vannamei]
MKITVNISVQRNWLIRPVRPKPKGRLICFSLKCSDVTDQCADEARCGRLLRLGGQLLFPLISRRRGSPHTGTQPRSLFQWHPPRQSLPVAPTQAVPQWRLPRQSHQSPTTQFLPVAPTEAVPPRGTHIGSPHQWAVPPGTNSPQWHHQAVPSGTIQAVPPVVPTSQAVTPVAPPGSPPVAPPRQSTSAPNYASGTHRGSPFQWHPSRQSHQTAVPSGTRQSPVAPTRQSPSGSPPVHPAVPVAPTQAVPPVHHPAPSGTTQAVPQWAPPVAPNHQSPVAPIEAVPSGTPGSPPQWHHPAVPQQSPQWNPAGSPPVASTQAVSPVAPTTQSPSGTHPGSPPSGTHQAVPPVKPSQAVPHGTQAVPQWYTPGSPPSGTHPGSPPSGTQPGSPPVASTQAVSPVAPNHAVPPVAPTQAVPPVGRTQAVPPVPPRQSPLWHPASCISPVNKRALSYPRRLKILHYYRDHLFLPDMIVCTLTAYGLFEGLKDAELSRTFRFNTCSAGPSGFCSRRVESLQHTTRTLVILQNDLADDESEQIRRKFLLIKDCCDSYHSTASEQPKRAKQHNPVKTDTWKPPRCKNISKTR